MKTIPLSEYMTIVPSEQLGAAITQALEGRPFNANDIADPGAEDGRSRKMNTTDTSREARPTASAARRLQDRCLEIFREQGLAQAGLTADEVAGFIGLPITSIRPRVSQLKKQGLIIDTKIRRLNASHNRAAVMRLAQP